MSDNHDVIISSDAIFCLPFYKFHSFKNFMQTTKPLYSSKLKNHALFKSQRPQTRPSELHLQSTVDKLSSSYVLVFNVSTVNLGRVNMDFGSFFGCMA